MKWNCNVKLVKVDSYLLDYNDNQGPDLYVFIGFIGFIGPDDINYMNIFR